MTKIAVTTKYSSYNFGAMLQTFALQKKIQDLGADCVVVDADRQRKRNSFSWNSLGQIVSNCFYRLYRKELERGYDRFDRFMGAYPLSKRYDNYDQLLIDPPEADIYLTGSDQIWKPLDIQENYFLRYAPDGKVRASYAASMGISYMPKGARRIFGEYLFDIDYVSVREKSAKEIIENLYGIRGRVDVDPTLLMDQDEWAIEAVKPEYHKNYILCYILYRPAWLNGWLKQLRRKTGKEIVVVTSDPYRNIFHTKMVRDAGPRELLGWIQNADFVISSSFHGVTLSIANNKPFYAVVNPDSPARISDLLLDLHLKDRIIDADHARILEPIDYVKTNEILSVKREYAFDYLKFLIGNPDKTHHAAQQKRSPAKNIMIVGRKCTGCTVCASVCPASAIQMGRTEEGFLYPNIDEEKCTECGRCLKYCHTIAL